MRPLRRIATVALGLAVATTAVAACGDDGAGSSGSSGDGVAVVATTSIVADFVRVVGGERVSLHQVLKPNVDAHDFEPTPKDLDALRRARVVVENGAGLETWLDDAVRASGTKATLVDTSEGVNLREPDEAEPGHRSDDGHDHEEDPHIWHDPRNAVVMVANVVRGLSAADPAGAGTYQANGAAYTAKLEQLDRDIEAQIATLANKKLVTNHDAFGYYVDRYGLTFVGSVIPSFDSATEVSAADVDELVRAIEAQGVKAVFAETALPSKVAATIAKEAGVKVVDGDDALYGDSLGTAKSGAGTYLEMMRKNTATLVKYLA